MLDQRIRPLIDPALKILAKKLDDLNIKADQVTIASWIFIPLLLLALSMQAYGWALLCIILNRIMDGLDGVLARLNQPTDRGGFLDIAGDFLFYGAVPFGFAIGFYHAGEFDKLLAAAFLLFSFIGTGTSFLAYAIMVEKQGDNFKGEQVTSKKSFFYLGGLTEGFETITALSLMAIFPQWFLYLAYGFAALCWITIITRLLAGWRDL